MTMHAPDFPAVSPLKPFIDDELTLTLQGAHSSSSTAVIGVLDECSRGRLFHAARQLGAYFTANTSADERIGILDSRDEHSLVAVIAGFLSGRSLAMLGVGAPGEKELELARRSRCRLIVHGSEVTILDSADFANLDSSPHAGLSEGDAQEAVVLFTSGTTGQPKGVRLSRANILSNLTAMLRTALPWHSTDRLGQILTITHSFGLSMALMAVARGVPIVFLPDGPPSRALVEKMERNRVSIFACVPYFLRLMSRRGMSLGTSAAPELGHLFLAGGGLADNEITLLLPEFHGALYLMYGFTETTARAAVRRYGDGAPSGSVGLPLPGTHIDVVGKDGAVLPVGQEGLIRATGPSIMIGYLGEPPRRRGEHFVTSDLGRVDAAGNLIVTGRQVEMMNFRGNRVSVVQIEAQAMRFEGVLDARAIPDSADEDAQCALQVILSDTADTSAVRHNVRSQIDPRGIVRDIVIVTQLPKTRSGKAIRRVGTGEYSPPH